ncbi:Eukaryotic translation initiation factor 3 subunit A [Smittium mucronatum]|uniref:Eukaryotic translation initiation factor 3 subunit A n=1 Tax=Smittium mucronatum TaxID=133383 RepID=A0A1R0H322_9FUNG|nr:Eukaryotic translation initiation factor 3 subunit A [Smittium mucronatum]
MAPSFQKPELALKRAEELIAVGQHNAALQTLHDVLCNKKPRNHGYQSYDLFLPKFVELCVEQRKGKQLKEGLQQYRNLTQNTSIESFQNMVSLVLKLSEEKVRAAQKQADKLSVDQIGDLEESETPESILLSVVSSEQTKDRTDRAVVTPWLKFLWEAYRNLLDLLRNNVRLDKLYQTVSRKAINFCVTYQRKTEFRRLCELLRGHLQAIVKYSNQTYSIDLTDPETMQRYIDTRFNQLNAAAELELWQESYRSIEDLNSLFIQSRRAVKPSALAIYYEKLTRIMFKAGNQLFLAAAWHCYYSLIKDQHKIVGDVEIKRAANNVLLSTLAVPIIRSSSRIMLAEASENKYRTTRLTGLLMLSSAPTRQGLISNISRLNLLRIVDPELRPIYELLEDKFHPLSICKKLTPILRDHVATVPDISKYVPLLTNVTLTRLIQQLSQVYSTVRLDILYKLAEFDEPFSMKPIDIERFVINGARRGEFQLRIDHELKAIVFDVDPFDASRSENSTTPLQSSPADLMRNQLSSIAISLSNVQRVICPDYIAEKAAHHSESIVYAKEVSEIERTSVAARKEYVEFKKRVYDEQLAFKKKEEARLRQIKIQQDEEKERIRQQELKLSQERARIEREREKIKREEAKRLAESLKSKSGLDVKIEDLESMDNDKLMQLHVQHMEKEKQDVQTKLKAASRLMDHLERAYRQEERPLLANDYEIQKTQDLENHENSYVAILENSRIKFEHDIAIKNRISRMLDDYTFTKNLLHSKNAEKVAQLEAEAKANLAKAKASRIEMYKKMKADKEMRDQQAEKERIEREEQERITKEKLELLGLEKKQALAQSAAENSQSSTGSASATKKAYVPPGKRAGVKTVMPPAPSPVMDKSPAPPVSSAPPARKAYVPPKRAAVPFESANSSASNSPNPAASAGSYQVKKPTTQSTGNPDSASDKLTPSGTKKWVPSFRK